MLCDKQCMLVFCQYLLIQFRLHRWSEKNQLDKKEKKNNQERC